MEKVVAIYSSFEEADRADQQQRWSMSPQERLALLEELRSRLYPNRESPPRLQRTVEFVPRERR